MNELLQALNVMMQYIEANGANMNQATQQELAVFFQEVTEFILLNQEQQAPQAPAPPPSAPTDLENSPYPSSNIHSFRYNPQNGQLFIKFMGQNVANNGPVYSYSNVPQNIFNIFRRGGVAPTTSGRNRWHRWQEGVTPSLGAAAYHLIRSGGYPYQRLT